MQVDRAGAPLGTDAWRTKNDAARRRSRNPLHPARGPSGLGGTASHLGGLALYVSEPRRRQPKSIRARFQEAAARLAAPSEKIPRGPARRRITPAATTSTRAPSAAARGCSDSPRIAPSAPAASTEAFDPADSTEPNDPAEPIERDEPNEPIDPIDMAEPIEPIDRNELREATDRNESSDHSESPATSPSYSDPPSPTRRRRTGSARGAPVADLVHVRAAGAGDVVCSTRSIGRPSAPPRAARPGRRRAAARGRPPARSAHADVRSHSHQPARPPVRSAALHAQRRSDPACRRSLKAQPSDERCARLRAEGPPLVCPAGGHEQGGGLGYLVPLAGKFGEGL